MAKQKSEDILETPILVPEQEPAQTIIVPSNDQLRRQHRDFIQDAIRQRIEALYPRYGVDPAAPDADQALIEKLARVIHPKAFEVRPAYSPSSRGRREKWTPELDFLLWWAVEKREGKRPFRVKCMRTSR